MESQTQPDAQASVSEADRFRLELEFVQALANPFYVKHLASMGYLRQDAFISYLNYLKYWSAPRYAKYLTFPQCLTVLQMLCEEQGRRWVMSTPASAQILHDNLLASQRQAEPVLAGSRGEEDAAS